MLSHGENKSSWQQKSKANLMCLQKGDCKKKTREECVKKFTIGENERPDSNSGAPHAKEPEIKMNM